MRSYNPTTYSRKDEQLTLSRRHFVISTGVAPVLVGASISFFTAGTAFAASPEMTDSDHVLGEPDAPITIIEYASLTCPHCAHFHETGFQKLKENYLDTGKARFIFRHFPLDRYAFQASVLAECAGDTKFFPLIDILFSRQAEWTRTKNPTDALIKIGKQAGVGQQKFEACLADEKLGESILNERLTGANDYDVTSTPTLFINGEKYEEDRSFEVLDSYLKSKM